MMLPLTSAAPTTAERIRSACARAGGALLAVEREEPVADAGAPPAARRILRGQRCPPSARRSGRVCGSQALLELTDYAPLPLREPVRSLVWVRGGLQQVPPAEVNATLDLIASREPASRAAAGRNPRSCRPPPARTRYTLLRLEIESVVVTDATGAEPVSIDGPARRPARPVLRDRVELAVAPGHRPRRRGGTPGIPAAGAAAARRVRPLGLDRYGVRFRIEGNDGDQDIRLPFHKPVDDMTGLSQAIRVLMGCPFINGLRARP